MPRLGLIGLTAASILAAATTDALGKRIALLDFASGYSSTDLPDERVEAQVAVARALRAENTVIPRRQVRVRLIELGLTQRCARENLVDIAKAVGADAVLCGKLLARPPRFEIVAPDVTRQRRGRVLIIEVHNGGDGRLLGTVRLRLGGQGLSRANLARLMATLSPALAKSWIWPLPDTKRPPSQASRPRRASRPTGRAELAAMASVPELGVWEIGAEGEGENDSGGLRERPLAPPRARGVAPEAGLAARSPIDAARHEGEHALRLGIGPGLLIRRNYKVYGAMNSRDGRGWTTSPVAGIAVSAEIYPGAWFSKGWVSHFGIGVSFERYFGPSWRVAASESQQTASHQIFSVDLRGRFALWRSPRALELLLRAGYRHLDSQMNESDEQLAAIPDSSISSLETGLALRLPILPRWLYLSAAFDYLTIFERGEIASVTEYGPSSGGGLLFGGGLHGEIYRGLGWRLDGSYAWYMHHFDAESGASRQADGAHDRYLTTQLLLTYRN